MNALPLLLLMLSFERNCPTQGLLQFAEMDAHVVGSDNRFQADSKIF
uniref:Uncharacterized protein n=1 Tax=Anguilla anguilla TaxID=7936 RepID=A0A0E9SU49_ANGAN